MMAFGEATGWCCNPRYARDLTPIVHSEQQPVSPTKMGQQAEPTEETHTRCPAAWRSWPCSGGAVCSPGQSVVTAHDPDTGWQRPSSLTDVHIFLISHQCSSLLQKFIYFKQYTSFIMETES